MARMRKLLMQGSSATQPNLFSQAQRFTQFGGGYNTIGLHLWFVIASLPAFVVGMAIPADNTSLGSLVTTALFLLISLSTSYLWHLLFARIRRRQIDAAWFMHGWLFCLLVPVSTSLPLVILGVSFGVIVGSLIFGGAGRYVVSPALAGALLLELSYPSAFSSVLGQSTWNQFVAAQGPTGASWLAVFGYQQGFGIGTVSAAACTFGALVLCLVGAISGRIVAGGLLGVGIASLLLSSGELSGIQSLPYYWHWILGSLPFCLAFLVTDPSISAVTSAGRWLYGGLFGVLVVLLRLCDPEHPEATLAAALLASLLVPLIDHCCMRVALARWKRRKRHFQQ